jgi:hypothetical protein
MTGQPATRSNELLDEINNLGAADRDNAFLLKSLERKATQVLRTGDYSGGYTLLGALAAVRGDAEETRSQHAKAVAVAPSDTDVLRNYAISLLRVGLIEDAITMADRSWQLDKTQVQNLVLLTQLTLHSGRVQGAVERLRSENLSWQNDAQVAELESAASFLAKKGVTDTVAGVIAREAMKVVAPISVTGVQNRVASDDETTWVDFALTVNDTVEKVMELNHNLAERLAELTLDSELGRASAAFVVRFTRTVSLDASSSN